MSATISGAVKARIESLGLSLSAYRDQAPPGTARPFCTVIEGISATKETHGDGTDGDRTATELVQVSLWQDWRDTDGSLIESPSLIGSLVAGLDGASLSTAPDRVWRCTVDGWQRIVEDEDAENTIHHPITLRVVRDL